MIFVIIFSVYRSSRLGRSSFLRSSVLDRTSDEGSLDETMENDEASAGDAKE